MSLGAPLGYYDGSYPPSVLNPTPPVIPSTGATAGTPGTFTPPGSTPPDTLPEMSSIVASPLTAWTVGQYVVMTGGSRTHWSGSAWVAGNAVAEAIPARPDDGFPDEHSVIGSTKLQASKLDGLGFVADPLDPWVDGEDILVNGYAFYWDGGQWRPGSAP